MSQAGGITDVEKRVLAGLNAAYGAWLDLPEKHPSDLQEFVFHLHALQNMVAFHVARRIDPEFWWTPKPEGESR